jgi:hypothetical protein
MGEKSGAKSTFPAARWLLSFQAAEGDVKLLGLPRFTECAVRWPKSLCVAIGAVLPLATL